MNPTLLHFDNTLPHDPAIDAWLDAQPGPLGSIARHWFQVMRTCGDEVRELLHDGCPNACLGNFPFAYVNIFTAHVNVGFFQGASLPDPGRLLQGAGKRMRHVKLPPESRIDPADLHTLIAAAYSDMKLRIEYG